MLTVYNNGVGYPISQDDYYIRELASGYDEIIFNVSIRDEVYSYINEEAIVRDRDQNIYLIKQIDAGNETAKVVAQINLDDWKQAMYKDYSNNSDTVANTVRGILPSGWSVIDYSLVTKRRTVPTSDTTKDFNVTALEILEACTSVYEVRFRFNTANKIIYIINPANYVSQGAFATRDLNLRNLNYKGKSDDFVTRLYASGADGMTFAPINGGKDYVENFNYSNKIVSAYWSDNRYTDMQSLLDDAQAKVDEMAKPSRSYDCDVLDLANTNPEMYGFEDFSLFNIVTLVDDAKEVRTDYQVVERWTYPYYPVRNKVVLSSATPNIQTAIATIVNSLSNSTSPFQQILQSAIQNATALITGNHGGYLVLHDSNDDGTPDELLIMDTPDIETATKVWRWNQAGLGYSNTGYNGTFTVGITMDGAIVADFITAGQLNGAIVEAGTIQANALSVEAKEDLAIIHQYLPSDAMSNRSLWETTDYYASKVYFETVGGKTYLVLDGSAMSAFDTNAYARINTDVVGDVDFTAHFKYHVSTQVTLTASQRFPFVSYVNTSGEGRVTWKWLPAQTIEANTDYEWNTNFSITGVDTNEDYVKFGLYFIPGTKIYVEEIAVTSSVDEFAQAGMSFTSKGLSVVVQEVEKGGAHSYIPYDSATNTTRWKVVNPSGSSGHPVVSHEIITVDGKSVDAIVLDGTSVPSNYETGTYAYLETDVIGTPQMTLTFGYRSNVTIAPVAFTSLCVFTGKTSTGTTVQGFSRTISNPNTIDAGVDYTDTSSWTPSQSLDPFYEKGQFRFQFHSGCKFYIYNLSLESTGDSYKRASLSYTTDGLNSEVQAGSIISTINQSAEQVSIQASKINLTGDLSLRGDFKSYKSGDATTYAFLDSGNLSFYNSGINVFTISSSALLGSYAGIFFGDTQDPSSMANYTNITQQAVTTPEVYVKTDSRYSSYSSRECVVEGDEIATRARFEAMDVNPWFFGSTHLSGGLSSSFTADVDFFDHNNSLRVTFYSTVYNNSGGVVFISDKRKKKNIKDLVVDAARSFIMALKPRKFKFKKELSGSDRYHHGFIAQEVKEAMSEDWGLYIEDQKTDFIGLRYDELLADMVSVIQDQEKRIEALERRVDDLTNN
jgi:phage minor structural protein